MSSTLGEMGNMDSVTFTEKQGSTLRSSVSESARDVLMEEFIRKLTKGKMAGSGFLSEGHCKEIGRIINRELTPAYFRVYTECNFIGTENALKVRRRTDGISFLAASKKTLNYLRRSRI